MYLIKIVDVIVSGFAGSRKKKNIYFKYKLLYVDT